jgi:hypothetical protein
LWQDEALALIAKYQLNPLRAARVLAYLHQAEIETREGVVEARCRVAALDEVSSRTVGHFFPLETPGRLEAKAALRRVPGCEASLASARKVFNATRALAESDGAFPPRKLRANPVIKVGSWKATPPVYVVNPAEPFAGEWRTFFVAHPAQLKLAPPPDPDSAAYRAATVEVLDTAKRLTSAERQAAEAWNLDAGSITPPGVWNLKLRELLEKGPDPGVDSLRLYAALNLAMYDAMTACWHYKYRYWTERPVTAAERLGVGSFTPYLVTPPFPSYPSGHATVSGAAAEVIAAYLPSQAEAARRWAEEAAMSRLWGGIHFRFDNDAGLALGRQVGRAALARMPAR